MRLVRYISCTLFWFGVWAGLALAAQESGSPWPRTLAAGGAQATIYPPQVLGWRNNTLTQQAAVAMVFPGKNEPVYGMLHFEAAMRVDQRSREAGVKQLLQLTALFPSERAREAGFIALFRDKLTKELGDVSLDWLDEEYAILSAKKAAEFVRPVNTPPYILIATEPSILVPIDGSPVWVKVPDTGLERVANSHMLLLRAAQARYYLRFLDGYLEAADLAGPWRVAAKAPEGAGIAERLAAEAGSDLMTPQAPEASPAKEQSDKAPSIKDLRGKAPQVYVASGPAELIVVEGKPDFTAIEGSSLLYVANTTANLFMNMDDRMYYALLSGRWFRSLSLDGPWAYVPGPSLPAAFANIPDSSPKENVKASVPGTVQAAEARIHDAIPQIAVVPRTAAGYDPGIDGTAQLRPIADTRLMYVVNAADPVILVDGDAWYAVHDAVWYSAPGSNGPWQVATHVPPEIYGIPMTSPLHNVTYVRIYGVSDNAVLSGYTPGYSGTVTDGETVVYGTGYTYTPWVGSRWYGSPSTYGLGASPFWTPWDGWGYGFGYGSGWYRPWGAWGYPARPWGYWGYPASPWWGPYRTWQRPYYPPHRPGDARPDHRPHRRLWGPGGWAGTRPDLYERWKNRDQAVTGQPGQRGDGRPRRFGAAYNSRTGALLRGEREAIANVYSDTGQSGQTQSPAGRRRTRDEAAAFAPLGVSAPSIAGAASEQNPEQSKGAGSVQSQPQPQPGTGSGAGREHAPPVFYPSRERRPDNGMMPGSQDQMRDGSRQWRPPVRSGDEGRQGLERRRERDGATEQRRERPERERMFRRDTRDNRMERPADRSPRPERMREREQRPERPAGQERAAPSPRRERQPERAPSKPDKPVSPPEKEGRGRGRPDR